MISVKPPLVPLVVKKGIGSDIAGMPQYVRGDWGNHCESDRRTNAEALSTGGRLLSAYALPDDSKVWIITEADRSATTLLLPHEY